MVVLAFKLLLRIVFEVSSIFNFLSLLLVPLRSFFIFVATDRAFTSYRYYLSVTSSTPFFYLPWFSSLVSVLSHMRFIHSWISDRKSVV